VKLYRTPLGMAAAAAGMSGGDAVDVAGIPKELPPGRYEVGITIRGVTGDATTDPPAIVPFLWNWDKGPFGSGKANLERELARQGIRAVAVTARNPQWKNPRRSGKLDLFGLSPMLWDVSFTLTLDLLGPTAGGLSGMAGLGIEPVTVGLYILATIAILAITQAIVKTLGGGDVVIDFVRQVGRAAGEVTKAGVEPLLDVAATPFKSVSGLILIGVGVVALFIWAKASPHGRAAKAALWG